MYRELKFQIVQGRCREYKKVRYIMTAFSFYWRCSLPVEDWVEVAVDGQNNSSCQLVQDAWCRHIWELYMMQVNGLIKV